MRIYVLPCDGIGPEIIDASSELSGSLGLAGSMMASNVACCAQAQHGCCCTRLPTVHE